MWIDYHPYISLYLAGCISVVLLILIKSIITWTIGWVTKSNTFNKNLKKLQPPDEKPFVGKVVIFFGLFAVEVALSWINVLVVLWQIASFLIRTLRELISSTPEAIKLLSFPLKNNPDMSRESVFAQLLALKAKVGGEQPNESELIWALNELLGDYPSFDRISSLKQLASFNVIAPEVISTAMEQLQSTPCDAEI